MTETGSRTSPVGVLLLTFGSAVTSAQVPAYLRSVRGGREPSAELVAEFVRRFEAIGRSPLIEITAAQAAALQVALDSEHGEGAFCVALGMLHSPPTVADGLWSLHDASVSRVVAIVLAPQYSPLILSGYERVLARDAALAMPDTPFAIAPAWHLTPSWIDSLAERLGEALDHIGGDARRVQVVFTAHSLPRPVVERDPGYLAQIHATIDAVSTAARLDAGQWRFAYQSAGHTPEEWLTPDLVDVLPDIRTQGATDVLVVPVQFVADHLEILYDIDVAAAEQARAAGLRFHRIEMPNAGARFVAALAEVVEREVAASPVSRCALGPLRPRGGGR